MSVVAVEQFINGFRYDFTSIRISILTGVAPVLITAITSVNYEIRRDIGTLRGTSARKLGRTRGTVDYTGSLTLYLEEWVRMRDALALSPFPLGGGYMTKVFDVSVAYREAPPAVPQVDTLIGCTITGERRNNSQGPDALMVDLDVDIMEIREGAFSPVLDFGQLL